MIVEEIVDGCRGAVGEGEPMLAVKELLEKAVADRSAIDALNTAPGLHVLHRDATLTIFNLVLSPGASSLPHDHRVWAVVGIFAGHEHNVFYRRVNDTLTESGGRTLRDRDVLAMGSETIHAISNPSDQPTMAIHVYGGDLISMTRSMWSPDPWREEAYDAMRAGGIEPPRPMGEVPAS